LIGSAAFEPLRIAGEARWRRGSGVTRADWRNSGRSTEIPAKEFLMSNFIDMLGCEYFFAPGPAFLASL
jgi:hypothetical protein